MIRLALAAAVLAAFAMPVNAQPTPQVKVGQCPSGYASEASYCVPMKRDAPVAIPKVPGRQCPSGYASEANYCVEMRRR
jgi:hypothetical protein